MHVCSRIVKVVSTKSIVIISSKDRDTPASINYTLVHKDTNITLLPMTPDSILKDDINRANKAKQEINKSENQIVAKEFEHQMKPNNKPSTVVSEIKLKSACLLATKSDIDELDFSKSVCYAFVCNEALFSFEDVPSSLPPAVTNIL